MSGFAFTEAMTGTAKCPGEAAPRRFRFELQARSPTAMRLAGTTMAEASGRVDLEGVASGAAVRGWLELSPFAERRMRYVLDFQGDDGRTYRFDGHKRIRMLSAASWTTLHGSLTDGDGREWGRAVLRFSLRRQLLGLVASVRLWRPQPDPSVAARALMTPRWRGAPGRLEVWYATLTDPGTGEGFWLHHELLAPLAAPARRQGWAVAFPPSGRPVLGRFAGEGSAGPGPGLAVFEADGAIVRDGAFDGRAGALAWDLRYRDDTAPLFTFPRSAWEHELLPAAQVVPAPSARFTGTITVGERVVTLKDAPGAVARIYGHGNAKRWGWLHADLGGGDLLEIVAAVSRRPGLERLRPLSFVALRAGGVDWPSSSLLAAPFLHTRLDAWGFLTEGRWAGRRLRAQVTLEPSASVTLDYEDPDGPGPRCTNSERASLELVLERRCGGEAWRVERAWSLDATAHAEVGWRE